MRLGVAFALSAVPAFLAAAPTARTARPFTPEELLRTQRPDSPQVSPDGKLVAFTVRQKSREENRALKDVWVVPFDGKPSAARRLTRDGKSENPRWSPDGRSILFTSSRAEGGQLFVLDLAGGDPRQLTSLFGGADARSFSP